MPSKPSAGKLSLENPVEYVFAAPSVCLVACIRLQFNFCGHRWVRITYSQSSDGDGVGVLLATDSGAITVPQRESLLEVDRSRARARGVLGVTGAVGGARRAGKEQVTAAGVKVD